MSKTFFGFSILLIITFLPVPTWAKRQSTIAYLQELHNQGKERVIVRFNKTIDPNVITRHGGKTIRHLKIINSIVCEIDRNKIELLKRHPAVKSVVTDAVISIPEPKESPIRDSELGALSYQGPVTIRWNNLEAGLNSQAAWDRYDLEGDGVKIAFLDTAINYELPDLDDNYLGGINIMTQELNPLPYIDPDPYPDDDSEDHGTFVASIAVGEGDLFVVGTAPKTKYYNVKVLDATATGLITDIISGIEWASTEPHKADIISISIASYDEDYEGIEGWAEVRQAYKDACDDAYAAGVILVAGSGNRGDTQYGYRSACPAAFANVISVGAHKQNQSIPSFSNGGVDVVAPGYDVDILHPKNILYGGGGTSFATPHASGLIALQLQYVRQNNVQPNNGYIWELLKHSAKDMPFITDPVYKGKGKIWAARTDANDPNNGAIDLMAANWPINYHFESLNYAFLDGNLPVYQIGCDVNQTIILENITNIIGNEVESLQNLKVTATHVYCSEPNEPNLPGNSITVFPTITALEPNEANSITLTYSYSIPPQTTPGLKKTKLQFEFNFAGDSRAIKIAYNEPNSFWYAAIPGDLDINNEVDFSDYSILARQWQQVGCNGPEWCGRADIDRNGRVDWNDLYGVADHWLAGQ
jgi:hypothetical protein